MRTSSQEAPLPCFFGDEAHRLYGCHHLPTEAARREAILICSATAHEYERCHRATRQLAVQFARAGYPALRFDYFGTGDSAGDYAEASLSRWRDDIAAAAAECRVRSARKSLCLAGLRLGATLAAQAAAALEGVTQLVLYAPILDGAALLEEWGREQAVFDGKHSQAIRRAPQEILGFPLGQSFRAQLGTGLAVPAPAPAIRRVLVLAERADEPGVRQAAAVLASRGAAVTVEQADGPAVWRSEPLQAIVPFKVLRRIVAWVGEGAR